jgi:hypothetical protein
MHAQAKGFVLRFAPPAFGDKAAPLDAHASTREGRADGEQLRLVVRPQATTPEAEREQQPIVTPFVVLTYSGRKDRVIQRRSLRGILPERIRLRASKGSNTSSLLLRGLRESWPKLQPLTFGRRLAQLDLVRPQPFQAACERLRHGFVADQFRYITAALSLEIWLRANTAPQRDAPLATFFSLPMPSSAPLGHVAKCPI